VWTSAKPGFISFLLLFLDNSGASARLRRYSDDSGAAQSSRCSQRIFVKFNSLDALLYAEDGYGEQHQNIRNKEF
jgi:hypothetical protein